MRNRLLSMSILVLGFLLAVFAPAWATILMFQRQITQNSGPVAVLAIIGLFLMAVGWKK